MDPADSGCCCPSSSSSSRTSPASSTSSSRPPRVVLPLQDRFSNLPEPIRTQLVDFAMHIIRDNVRRYVRHNLDHINRDREGVGRCRSCIKRLASAVDVAEGTGVEVEEQYKNFLQDLHDEGQWRRWESFKRKRHEVFKMQEEVNRMLENYYKQNSSSPPPADLKHEEEEEEDDGDEDEEGRRKKQRTINAMEMEGIDVPPSGGGHGRVAWAVVKKSEEEEPVEEEEEDDEDESLEVLEFMEEKFENLNSQMM